MIGYSIADIGTIVAGKTPSTKEKSNFIGSLPFITPSDLQNGKYINDAERHISDVAASCLSKIIIPTWVRHLCVTLDLASAGTIGRLHPFTCSQLLITYVRKPSRTVCPPVFGTGTDLSRPKIALSIVPKLLQTLRSSSSSSEYRKCERGQFFRNRFCRLGPELRVQEPDHGHTEKS